jgi:hypothetical protein
MAKKSFTFSIQEEEEEGEDEGGGVRASLSPAPSLLGGT